MLRIRSIAMAAYGLLCAGCAGWQSVLDPHGAQSRSLSHLILLIVAVCALVWVLVMLALALALRVRGFDRGSESPSTPTGERQLGLAVALALAITTLVIIGFTLASFITTRALDTRSSDALEIRVRGYQWWWEITYLDPRPDQVFMTANEIHIPVGRPVRLELAAADVIHSFWVPNLAGKKDMIPGRSNQLTLLVSESGTFRGQCAEFCGLQHAHMALLVIAESPEAFERWRQGQVAPAAAPTTPDAKAGQQVFASKPCAACHSVQGSSAAGSIGPDLTHIGGRRYIGAGLLETTRGSLAAWIADPQTLKPGVNMPQVPLSATELTAVSAYLASLQ